jgi:putative FmdB family regulatory protein
LPIYTYECQSCSATLEKRQSFSEDPLTIHETCGGKLRRIIHPAGIVFKGSGFYNTDYKNATPSNKPAGDTTTDAKKPETAASDNGTSTSTSASSSDAASTSGSTPAAPSSAPASSSPAPTTP